MIMCDAMLMEDLLFLNGVICGKLKNAVGERMGGFGFL